MLGQVRVRADGESGPRSEKVAVHTQLGALLDLLDDGVGEVFPRRPVFEAPPHGQAHGSDVAQLRAEVRLAQPGNLPVPVDDAQLAAIGRKDKHVVDVAAPVHGVEASVFRLRERAGNPFAVFPFGGLAHGLGGPSRGGAQAHVFDDVARVAVQPPFLGGNPAANPCQARLELGEVGVSLILREAAPHHRPRLLVGHSGQEVDHRVVRGREGREEGFHFARPEVGQNVGVEVGPGEDDRVADRVFPPAARAPDELRVLRGAQVDEPLPVPPPQRFDDDGAHRHVDAQGKGAGRVDDPQQAVLHQLLRQLLDRRIDARVVGAVSASECARGGVEADGAAVGFAQGCAHLGDPGRRLGPFFPARERNVPLEKGLDRLVAAFAREDELDGRKHVALGQKVDDPPAVPVRNASAPVRRQLRDRRDERAERAAVLAEKPEDLPSHGDLLPEGNRPDRAVDKLRLPAHGAQPSRELARVRDGGGQADEPAVFGQGEDDFLPHRPALPVREIVDFVEDDVSDVVDVGRARK